MRFYIVFLILTISTSIVAQKRTTIFKEIHNYRDSVYNKTTYQTDSLDFAYAINQYFLKDGFAYVDKTNPYDLHYQKLIYLMCSTGPRDNIDLPGGRREKCTVTVYVLVDVIDTNEVFSFALNVRTEDAPHQFLQRRPPRILGQYKFDETALREHLYVYYHENKPTLSLALLEMIAKYNGKQKQEDKKIIAGRNY